MSALPQIFLNKKNARNFSGFHPWVMARSIIEPTAPLEAGQAVDLVHADGKWIGRGVYNPRSRIRVRLYQWRDQGTFDAEWCVGRLTEAISLRLEWMSRNTKLDAVRLVNSEGDGLSGLIVDQFGSHLIVQFTSLAMLNWQDSIVAKLVERITPESVLVRVDDRTSKLEGIDSKEEVVHGRLPEGPLAIEENGVKLEVDIRSGQKTGYYLDQRANRRRVASWVVGGPMLDVCSYHAGFSLAAAKYGAPEKILAIDSSEKALSQARRNAELNSCQNIEFHQADCFDYLAELVRREERFQTVVLDPPRMASNRGQLQSALRAYHRLNLSAVNLLRPGGILATCSCSGRVTRPDMVGMLASVARRSGRSIQIVETLGADFDHPVNVNCPETEYLKCLICRVT